MGTAQATSVQPYPPPVESEFGEQDLEGLFTVGLHRNPRLRPGDVLAKDPRYGGGVNGLLVAMGVVTAVLAVADWVAVWRRRRKLRWLTKPGTMVALIVVAVLLDPADPTIRSWFVAALVLSLAGDVFLMLAEKWFVAGLGSFLLAHLAYVVGLLLAFRSGWWSMAGLVLVAAFAIWVGRRVVAAVSAGDSALVGPVVAYIAVISAMVVAAFGTAAGWAVAGALLFYASDSILAWDRFVESLRMGPPAVMITYHLAQVSFVVSLVTLASG